MLPADMTDKHLDACYSLLNAVDELINEGLEPLVFTSVCAINH